MVAENFTCNGSYITRNSVWSLYFLWGLERGKGTSPPERKIKIPTWNTKQDG